MSERVEFVSERGENQVLVVANVSLGRTPPLPCSERSFLDPGDPPEVELLSVEEVGEILEGPPEAPHRRYTYTMNVLSFLTERERRGFEDEALDRALESGSARG